MILHEIAYFRVQLIQIMETIISLDKIVKNYYIGSITVEALAFSGY